MAARPGHNYPTVVRDQSFDTPLDPPPRHSPHLGHKQGKAQLVTLYSLHFGRRVGGEYARNHGLRLLDQGISRA